MPELGASGFGSVLLLTSVAMLLTLEFSEGDTEVQLTKTATLPIQMNGIILIIPGTLNRRRSVDDHTYTFCVTGRLLQIALKMRLFP